MDNEELTEEQKKERMLIAARVEKLSENLLESLKEAIAARAGAGIDQRWQEDDQLYNGYEDYSNVLKGKTIDDTPKKKKRDGANEFLNITRKYTDAASAKLGDMLFPTDDSNFSYNPTPIPEKLRNDDSIMLDPDSLEQMQNAQGEPLTLGEQMEAKFQEAAERARNGERRVSDWLVECDYNGEGRRLLEYVCRLGVGVMKGAVADEVEQWKVIESEEGVIVESRREIKPVSKCISPWNFFPDAACGDNIHNGSHTWERVPVSSKTLEKLAQTEGYIKENILLGLKETPQRQTGVRSERNEKGLYEVFYFYGRITKDDFKVLGGQIEDESELENVDAFCVLFHGRVIKVGLNPLPSGAFPYDAMPYTFKEGTWVGDGIPRQMRTPQLFINAGLNATADNHGLSSGSILFLKKKGIKPQDGKWEIAPNKVYLVDEDVEDVRKSVYDFQIPSYLGEGISMIEFALKLAEDVTGLPMLLQGQMGKAPDTLGGMQMLNNNASTVLRRLAKIFDDRITEPHMSRYHEWLIEYGENEEEKCDVVVDARGSSALVERDIQNQTIAQMLQLSLNPAYGIDPKRAYAEYLKSLRLNPDTYRYSEQELQQQQAIAQQAPPDPRIATAQINQAIKQEQLNHDRQENQQDRAFEMRKLEMQLNVEMMKMANQQNMTLEQIKADMAKNAMSIKNQREIFAAEKQIKDEHGSGI